MNWWAVGAIVYGLFVIFLVIAWMGDDNTKL